ncbi:MAG: VacJ family lipoprotein [Candidatus Sumerlaeota bacterium]
MINRRAFPFLLFLALLACGCSQAPRNGDQSPQPGIETPSEEDRRQQRDSAQNQRGKEYELLEKYKANPREGKEYELLRQYQENTAPSTTQTARTKGETEKATETSAETKVKTKTETKKETNSETETETSTATETSESAESSAFEDDLALLDELNQIDEEQNGREQANGPRDIPDPIKYWNVAWFQFNDKLYFWVLEPVGEGYAFILPLTVRESLDKAFDNLEFPRRFVNCTLQGRFVPAGEELGAFLLNSTVGVLGLWNPASKWFGWTPENRDFDQTLGKYHIPPLMYVVWPIFGPSSVRGTFGIVADRALDGATYITGAGTIALINGISLGDHDNYETLRKNSLTPYIAVRDAYVQSRNQKVQE